MISGWSEVFLGVIATGALVTTLIQIGAVIAALRIAREARQMITAVHQDLRPLVTKVSAMADDASRTLVLAKAQAEKVDRLTTDLSRRVEETAAVLQEAIITPAREGMALVAALRAGIESLRGWRAAPANRRSAEDEDPLFIG